MSEDRRRHLCPVWGSKTSSRTVGVLLLVASTLMLAVGGALAPTAGAQQLGPDEAPPAVELIMDASGSMNGDDGTGRPKIAAAKEALTRLVAGLPEGAPVGLRVYGHRVPNDDKANGCRDTELIVPVGPLDAALMNQRIAGFEAKGFTPIGLSLQEAAADLPPEGERTIILVSDGEDTCAPPDPCQVARDLAAEGVELRIETVGFQVDAAAADQLRCIAEATGGSYVDAPDAASLTEGLEDLSARALRTYVPEGTAVRGGPGPTCEGAPAITPGQYTDSMGGGEERWYAVELQSGQRLLASGTLVLEAPVARASYLDVEAYDSAGSQDGQARDVLGGSKNILSGGVIGDPFGEDEGSLDAGDVERTGFHCIRLATDIDEEDGPFLVELLVQVEGRPNVPVDSEGGSTGAATVDPDADSDGGPANEGVILLIVVGLMAFIVGALIAGLASARWSSGSAAVLLLLVLNLVALPRTVAAQEAEPIEGGGSFNNAPALEPGTYRDGLVATEFLYFSFDLRSGQRATVRAEAVHDGGSGRAIFIGQFFDPLRNRIVGNDIDGLNAVESTAAVELVTETLGPSGSNGSTRPGRHYFSLGLGESTEGLEGREFPVTFGLQIDGEAVATTTTTVTSTGAAGNSGGGGSTGEGDPATPDRGPVAMVAVGLGGLVGGAAAAMVGRRLVVDRSRR